MFSESDLVELELTHEDGTLNLVGPNEVNGVEFDLAVVADETEWGSPEAVRRTLLSTLADGSASVTDRYDNRTIEIKIAVGGADGASLAVGEQALMRATGRNAELTWTPPYDFAPPCVFVVVNSDLTYEPNHNLTAHFGRVYTLHLEALPFARSLAPVVIEALPPFVAVPVVLNDCSTTTGWTAPAGGSVSATAGVVTVNGNTLPATLNDCSTAAGWSTPSGGSATANGGTTTVAFGYFPTAMQFTAAVALTGVTKPYIAIESTLPSSVNISVTKGTSNFGLTLVGTEGNWRFYAVPSGGGGSVSQLTFRSASSVSVDFLTLGHSDVPAVTGPYSWSATITGVTKPYLAIESTMTDGGAIEGQVGSGASTALAVAGAEGNWRFYVAPAGLTSLKFSQPSSGTTQVMSIGHSDVPAATAGRQSLRAIPTPGSARADGSLLIESRNATTAGTGTTLGQVITYTGPQYDPRLSPYRVGGASPDPLALSGKSATGATQAFTRYATDFPPGSYAIWASVKGTPGALNWSVDLNVVEPFGGTFLRSLAAFNVSTTLVGTGYNLIRLGTLDLPGAAFDQSSSMALRFVFTAAAPVTLDEALVFNRTMGRLSVVDTRTVESVADSGSGWAAAAGATRAWFDAATLERGERIVAGRPSRALSMPVSQSNKLLSYDGAHLFTPDATYLYVATTECADPKVTGSFRPAWHTHPAA